MAFNEFGKAVFGEDFGVFGKKTEEQAGQEDIEGMDVFGFLEMVGAADLVEKAPHFFGGFGVGRIFFKSAAFFQACEGKEKSRSFALNRCRRIRGSRRLGYRRRRCF